MRPKKENQIKPLEAAAALIACNGNQTKAYKMLKPNATEGTAETEGRKLLHKPRVKQTLKKAFDESGIDLTSKIKQINQSIDVGWGIEAKHKDAVASLKLLFEIYKMANEGDDNKDDLMALQLDKIDNIHTMTKNLIDQFRIYKTSAIDQ